MPASLPSRRLPCPQALGPQAIQLPRYGVGHSLGALLHCLIGSRYPIVSAGNVLMSYNNRPATGGQHETPGVMAVLRVAWLALRRAGLLAS